MFLDDKLIVGMTLGFILGACLVHSSKKVQNIIEQGKDKLVETMEKI